MWNEQQNQHQHQHHHHAHTTSTSTTNAPPLFSQIPQQTHGHGQVRLSKSAPCSPLKPLLSKRPTPPARSDSFHVIHKVPVGDTPYVKAKHVQLVDKDPNRAIALFWAAINAGDRVDSALKDMAIVMKQQNRPEEAIEAIKSLRYRCSDHAQESLDNVLLDLYKRCGRLDDQIALLKHKLHLIHQGLAFNGRRTKTARSQGKKFQVSIEQEATRLLGNLGWAYMQQSNFIAAEAVYRKALSIEPDNNKVCNLGICLMKQGRLKEAKAMLKSVKPACGDSPWGSDSHLKSFDRAQQMLQEMEGGGGGEMAMASSIITNISDEDLFTAMSAEALSTFSCKWNANQNPINDTSDLSGALFATSGFGPSSSAAAGAAGAMVSSSSSQRPPLPPPPPSSIVSCKGEAMAMAMAIPQNQQAAAQQGETMAMAMAFLNQNQNQSLPLLASAAAVPGAMNGKWEEEDAEHGFGDENKTDHPHHSHHHHLLPRQSTNWHAESLRVKLEKVVMVSNNSSNSNNAAAVPSRKSTTASSGHGILQMKRSNSSSSMTPLMNSSPSSMNWGTQTLLGESNGSLLNSAALPFVAAPRSSSSSSSSSGFGASSCPNTTCKVLVSSSSENQEKKKAMASSSSSRKTSSSSSHSRSPSLQNLVLPDRSGATPEHAKKSCCKSLSFLMDKQEAHGSNNNANSNGGDDAWSSLGFIQADSSSPLCTIATVLRKRSTSSLSSVTAMSPLQAPAAHAEEEEEQQQDEADNGADRAAAEEDEQEEVEDDDDFQRRLQVFVEMTLPV